MTSWLAGWDAAWKVDWFGYDEDPSPFAGYGPAGVATFALALDVGFTLHLSWASGICDHRDGTEQRIATLLRPAQSYRGAAKLAAGPTRLTRARMARYAAQGAVFLLGLPHEALPLTRNASGSTVYVSSLALCDWKQIGQRVTVIKADYSASVDAIIQSVGSGQLELDVSPGSVGNAGGLIMPAMAVYLDPQQGFDRFRTAVETWQLSARAAIFDFAPPSATLDLETTTGDPAMAGAFLTSRRPGLFGEYAINFANSGSASLSEVGFITTVFFKHDVTTLGDVATLLESSLNVKLTGSYNPSAVITLADEFTAFMDGTDAQGPMGTGASLVTYAGHPVWDRRLDNRSTAGDQSHGLTELVDLGGVPVAIGYANAPLWGRAISFARTEPSEWQWLKLFLATVRGQQRMFWLPTWRDDFTFVSASGTSLVLRTDDDSDIGAWWPAQRDRLQLVFTDATVQYIQVTAVVDHGNGTQTLTLSDSVTSTNIAHVGWLEAVRFEQDDFEIQWSGGWRFSLSTMARAHIPTTSELAETDA